MYLQQFGVRLLSIW